MNKGAAAQRLADEVSARMSELGHTYQSLSDETALYGNRVSPSGIAKICQGRVVVPQRATRIVLERALDWPAGYLSRLNGNVTALRPRAHRPETSAFETVTRDITKLADDFEAFAVTLERVIDNVRRLTLAR